MGILGSIVLKKGTDKVDRNKIKKFWTLFNRVLLPRLQLTRQTTVDEVFSFRKIINNK